VSTTPNFGRKSIDEITEDLARLNLKLGMALPGGPIRSFVWRYPSRYPNEMNETRTVLTD
jgi:hypothetical protein